MPITKNVYQEGTKIKSMCRVCLTQSNHIMFRLADPLKTEENIEAKTYLEALEKTVCARVELNGKFPESICPMCVSFLKMALQFITQFKESQTKIQAMFKTSSPVYYNTIKPREQCDVETVAKVQIESKLNEVSPVELIVKDQAYSLNQLVVVENVDQSEHDYKGFINNLGKEISATLVNSTQKTKSKNNITIIKENSDEEIDNIDSDDYQEELESIKIEYDDAECDFKREIDDNTEMDEDNNDEIIEYIVEDDQNTEDLESNEQSDNAEEQENVDKTEEYDSESRSEHSENENYEYIEIDMLDKDAIESLIIDRAKVNAKDTQQFQQQRNRRKKSVTDSPKDEFEREVKFPCGVCKKIFSSARTLKNHVRRTHMAKYEKVFTCEVCGAVCETRSKFVNHKLQHVEKQFKCELCDKTYSTKAHLKVHMNVHANKRPFLCNVCGKDFNYANALTYHMRLHTGEKNYHCEYCPKRFRMINSLNRHLRTHTGEKPYKCQYCGRNFSSKGEVVCHEYIHTGYRPYHCKYCKKGFSKTHNLKIHLLSHGGPYNCKICKKTFIEPNILSMHHRIAHKDLAAELNNEENENSDSEDNSPKVEYEEDSTVEYVDAEEVEMNEAEFIYTDDS